MKILLVITKSEIGGAQIFVLNLARALKRLGYNVDVAAGEGDYLSDELQKHRITFHYFDTLKRNFNLISSIRFIFKFYKFLKINKYDIIHLNSSNTLTASIAAHLLKKRPKIMFTFHGLSFLDNNFSSNFFIKLFAKFYFKFFLKMVDSYVFVSHLNYKASKKAKLIKSGEVIYNGLEAKEMNFLSKVESRTFLADKLKTSFSNSYIIGSVGRLAYQKNYEFFINNFLSIKQEISNSKLIIIGEGPDYDKLKSKIIKQGFADDIYLMGALKDSYKYLKGFDIFVLPSRYEGLSISIIEAILADIPVLASDVGGNPEIINSEQLFKLDDIEDFVNKLLRIKNDPEKFIKKNAKIKNDLSLDKMIEAYRKLYERNVKI